MIALFDLTGELIIAQNFTHMKRIILLFLKRQAIKTAIRAMVNYFTRKHYTNQVTPKTEIMSNNEQTSALKIAQDGNPFDVLSCAMLRRGERWKMCSEIGAKDRMNNRTTVVLAWYGEDFLNVLATKRGLVDLEVHYPESQERTTYFAVSIERANEFLNSMFYDLRDLNKKEEQQ